MKKLVSMICAVALAAVCAVSAFAAGTPGEVARELNAKEEWTASDFKAFEEAVSAVDGKTVNIDMFQAYCKAASYAAKNGDRSTSYVNDGYNPQKELSAVVTVANAPAGSRMKLPTLTAVEGKTNTYSLSAEFVDAAGNPASNGIGFLVELFVPRTDCDMYTLTYANADGSITTIDTIADIYDGFGFTKVRAWVPHFSTYTLVASKKPAPTPAATATPAPSATPAPTATPAPAATVAPAPAAAPAAPIKATGADMSAAALVVALGIAASVGGAAYLTKKNGLGK